MRVPGHAQELQRPEPRLNALEAPDCFADESERDALAAELAVSMRSKRLIVLRAFEHFGHPVAHFVVDYVVGKQALVALLAGSGFGGWVGHANACGTWSAPWRVAENVPSKCSSNLKQILLNCLVGSLGLLPVNAWSSALRT